MQAELTQKITQLRSIKKNRPGNVFFKFVLLKKNRPGNEARYIIIYTCNHSTTNYIAIIIYSNKLNC